MHRGARALTLILCATAACRDGGDAATRAAVAEGEGHVVEKLDPALARNLPQGATMDQAMEGQRLFEVCAVCHGTDARGTQLGPSLRSGEWIHIQGETEQIAEIIRAGVPQPKQYPVPMPPGGGGAFDDGEVRALATYVYVLSRSGE